jgi:hypothetical protein
MLKYRNALSLNAFICHLETVNLISNSFVFRFCDF